MQKQRCSHIQHRKESQCSQQELGITLSPMGLSTCIGVPSGGNKQHHRTHSALGVKANAPCGKWGIRLGLSSAALSCHQKGTTITIKHGTGMSCHAIKTEKPTPSNMDQGCFFMPLKGNNQHHQTSNRLVFACHHKGTSNTIKHGTGMSFHAIKRQQPAHQI